MAGLYLTSLSSTLITWVRKVSLYTNRT